MIFRSMILIAGLTLPLFGQDDLQAKNIFIESAENRKTAVKFDVLLNRNGKQRRVPANFRFISSDRMKFHFELNRQAYVYVLHRTVTGDPEQLRQYAGPMGIEIIRDDDRRTPDTARYQLLFPAARTGRNNRLAAHKVYSVPTGDTFFNMDDNPGIEKLFIVVSETPVDIHNWYNVTGDVGGRLSQMSKNMELSVSKDISVVEGYGIGIDRAKPMVVVVDLNHYGR